MIFLKQTKLFFSLVLLAAGVLLLGLVVPEAFAVRSPEHYEAMARSSAIKAIAVVQDVKILEETREATRKEVVFQLEKALGAEAPATFRGTCFSVDRDGQEPEAGGTIYYYPQKGVKVLVTVSSNGGAITSYTVLSPELEKEVTANGLTNISFAMGRAAITTPVDQGKVEQWFTFHADDTTAGFLHISQKRDHEKPMVIEFTHELLVGERDGDRKLYTITIQSRQDATLTPEWLTFEVTDITAAQRTTLGKREVGFRSVSDKDAVAGILVRGNRGAVDVRIPPATTTDFLLFSLIEKLPFATGSSISLNLIETLELHLKKNIMIRYVGSDDKKQNLHAFVESGPVQATYWLDDAHQLQEVRWDSDKVFRRSSESEALTILQ